MGGHYVTCAGVNTDTHQLGVSDPYRDNAEAGKPGRVPVAHTYPHGTGIWNDGLGNWLIELYPEPEYFGGPNTLIETIYELHFQMIQNCDPMDYGAVGVSPSMVSGQQSEFLMNVSAGSPPPVIVLVEIFNPDGEMWAVAWSWPHTMP